MKRFIFGFAALAILMLVTNAIPTSVEAKEKTGSVYVESYYESSETFEDSIGEVQKTSIMGGISYSNFAFEYKNSKYDWDNMPELWDNMNSLSLGYTHNGSINSSWSYSLGGNIASKYEEEMSDSYSLTLLPIAIYNMPKSKISFTLGVAGTIHPAVSTVFPIASVGWNLKAKDGFSASVGVPTKLTYKFNQKTMVELKVSMIDEVYRLADDSKVRPEGYFEEKQILSNLYFSFYPVDKLNIAIGATYNAGRSYTTYDDEGDNDVDTDLDPCAGAYARLAFEF